MNSEDSKNRQELIKSIIQSMRLMRNSIRCSRKNHSELTHSQWSILHQILKKEAQTTKELAEYFHLSKSAITQQVDALVEKGLLIRNADTHDRRKIILTPSSILKKRAKTFHKQLVERMTKIFSPLTSSELKKFEALNSKIVNNLTASSHE